MNITNIIKLAIQNTIIFNLIFINLIFLYNNLVLYILSVNSLIYNLNMYISNNGNFKEGIVWWDTKADLSADVDVFFYIHDFKGVAKYKYGFKSLEFDLSLSKEERWENYQSSLRRQLRRSQEIGFDITFSSNPTNEEIKKYVEVYNLFADFKKLQKTSEDMLKQIRDDGKLVISWCKYNGELITTHLHYVSGDRVRMYQSCSTNNSLDNKDNAQSNKLLTEKDIEFFKSNGQTIYDFGGIGTVDGDNSKFEGIIKFKKLFGGKEIILWKGVTPNGETGEKVYKKYWR